MPEESNTAVIAAIAANAAVTTLKLIAAAVTGSSAMLSEGVHSLVDTGDSVLLFVGKRLSRRPADPAHPLGYGRELYFWSMVVAMIIFGAGGCINIYEGVTHILHPRPAENLKWSYIVLGCAAILDGISLTVAYRHFKRENKNSGFFAGLRRTKDPTTFAVILEDSADLLGITAAVLGIWLSDVLHYPALDGVASVVIGGILASVAFLLGRECRGLLIGESADRELVDNIARAAKGTAGVEEIGDPLTMQFGPKQVMLALPVRFSAGLDATSLARTIDRMEGRIRDQAPQVQRIFIEPALQIGPSSERAHDQALAR